MSTYRDCEHTTFTSWEGLRQSLLNDAGDDFVWRGVANAEWCIETSLDRFAREHHINDRNLLQSRLEKLYAKYLEETGIDQPLDKIRTWALGQHFGLPTPFLDWSRSPMAALYFAASGNDPATPAHRRQSVVWRLHYTRPEFESGDVMRVDPGSGPWNERLRAQQGVFTHLQHGGCLIDALQANKGYLEATHAYIYPADLNPTIMRDLSSMMITDLSMFPDHEGVIRYVRTLAGGAS